MVNVIKATGEIEPFSEEKLIRSIKRAGIPKNIQKIVLDNIKSKLYENIKTLEIYGYIKDFLEKSPVPYSRAKYSLKQAITDLGPTGYPFEDFVAEIFNAKGYLTQVRSIVRGFCISHEIDVIAYNEISKEEEQPVIVEVKFHNTMSVRTDVHVALYTQARFEDIKKRHGFGKVWLVTNTKITGDAIAYANCVGMKVLSWSYPEGEGLREQIEKYTLFPITALTTLSQSQKQELINNHIVLCKALYQNPSSLDILGIDSKKKEDVIKEAMFVCGETINNLQNGIYLTK